MERWLERLGYAVQYVSNTVLAATGDAAGEIVEEAGDAADDLGIHAAAPLGGAAGMVASAAGGWLATRLLGAREISLGRAVLAGVIGTVLYDAVSATDQRLSERKFDTIPPIGEAVTDDEDLQRWIGWAAHYAAGVGLAILYARHLYGRLPLPPVAQGAAFGLLDAATLSWGGIYPLLNRAIPGIELPPGYAGLATDPELTARSALRHLAFGVSVGLVYRPAEEAALPRWRRELVE